MNNKNTNEVGFLGLLTLLFIGLKLTGHIAWSWVWVLSPIWIPISIALTTISLVVLLVALGKIDIDKIIKYERKEK